MDNTPNLQLKKPKPEDFYNIQDHNENSDILDGKIQELTASKLGKDEIGVAGGIAGLDADGKLVQMPNAADVGAVPVSRTVNGKVLSENITLSASDVGALDATRMNQPGGIAGLDADGKLLQTPSAKNISDELFIVSATQPTVQPGKIWLKPIT